MDTIINPKKVYDKIFAPKCFGYRSAHPSEKGPYKKCWKCNFLTECSFLDDCRREHW